MDFKEYQKFTAKTAIYPKKGKNFIYPTLGLVGEAGEVAEGALSAESGEDLGVEAEKIKKVLRDNKGKITSEHKKEIAKELGDVLWYISQLAAELKISLNDIANQNMKKLSSRKKTRCNKRQWRQ